MDVVLSNSRLPRPGETVSGTIVAGDCFVGNRAAG